MPIDVQIQGDDSLAGSLDVKFNRITDAVLAKMDEVSLRLLRVAQRKASGEVLQVRTGNLLRSIEAEPPTEMNGVIRFGLSAGGFNAPYAKFLELGTKGPYEIVAVEKDALRFFVDGKKAFAKYVWNPGLDPHSFLRSTLREQRAGILSSLKSALKEA